MRKVINILSLIIIFSLIIGTTPIKSENDLEKFYFLEKEIVNLGEFIENGVRLEYNSKNNLEDELQGIKSNLEKLYKKEIYIRENKIYFNDEYREISVLVWKNEKDTKVRIDYINNRKNYTISKVKKELEQVQYFAADNIKYFDFIRVKIIEDKKQNLLDLLKSNVKIETLEELNIVNGLVGKGELLNGSKFNYSLMNYDGKEYLILGTPVIFITY